MKDINRHDSGALAQLRKQKWQAIVTHLHCDWLRNRLHDTRSRDALHAADKAVDRQTIRWPPHAQGEQHGAFWTEKFRAADCFVYGSCRSTFTSTPFDTNRMLRPGHRGH